MAIIKVENLSKKYLLSHRRQSYYALRDVIADAVNNLGRRVLSPFSSRSRSSAPSPVTEDFWALIDVSFEIRQGDRVGIIGRNGAGKSTLLKILSRITEPTKGRITIEGRVASLLEVGTGFHPELTGRENIYLSGAILGMSKTEIKEKFDEIVDFAEVEKFLDTPVKRYSSGMYVRLAFAVAAYLEPEVLVVDEVLAVGDAQFQKKCLGKMEEVSAKEGRTVLFVSHNMAAIQRLCGSAILLNQGRIKAIGSSEEVVGLYIRGGVTNSLCWENSEPSKKNVYFNKIYLTDETGEPASFVSTGDSYRVIMDFIVRQAPPNLQLSIGLLDSVGEVIFASSPQDAGLNPPEGPGSYRAVMFLPAEIFMPRTYTIRAVLWTPELLTIDRRDDISFSVQETASLCNSTPGGRAGIIALRCKWVIDAY